MTESQLFQSALEITNLAARHDFLQSLAADHPELVTRVEAMLASQSGSGESPQPHPTEPIDASEESSGTATLLSQGSDSPVNDPQLTAAFPLDRRPDTETPERAGVELNLGCLSPSDKPGSLGRLAHYEVNQILGRGAFGIVLKAVDEKLQRVVAIKLLALEIATTSPARKRFLREARTSASVRHEHVVNIYAVEEQPVPYMVMEYIPGQTLQQRLDDVGPLDVATVLRLGRQIAEGLAAAHAEGLIHRDIKPGNILLEAGVIERVKITDFGLARAADDASMTQSGLIAGTPMYMAPEQAMGHKIDQRADLFSLGSVLYQMISGRAPFRAQSTLAVLKRVAEEEPRPIPEIIPETPDWLCHIITRLHAKKPNDRFQTAAELAALLADCEAKVKLKQEDSIVLPPSMVRSRIPWLTAALVIVPLLALGIAMANGALQFWSKPVQVVIDKHHADEPITGTVVDGESVPGLRSSREIVADVVPLAVPQAAPLPPTFTNSLGMEFVIIPKGKSWLGGGKDRFGKMEVNLPNDFYLGKYEVTQDQWLQVMGTNPSSCHEGTPDELPVESMSWESAQEFLAKLNQRDAQTGWTYRLPTEVEWEYACRGGPMTDRSQSRYDFYLTAPLNDIQLTQANFGEESTTPVGAYAANSLGLYDMHGNVHEWCSDPVEGPYGRLFRAHRGGCWRYGADPGRAATEGWFPPAGNSRHLGFRLARVPVTSPPLDAAKSRGAITAADIRRITALPVKQRVAEVVNEIKARHPGLEGNSAHVIEAGKVTGFTFRPHNGHVAVSDLSPLKALPDLNNLQFWNVSGVVDLDALKGLRLTGLVLGGHDISNPVSSLEPLRGMPLSHLRLYQCEIQDLEPLRGMPLELLALDRCAKVRDLSPLQGMPLINVSLGYTGLQSLEVFRGLPLKHLTVQHTGVTDLTPLEGLELQTFLFTPKSITAGLDVLRKMKSLNQIGLDYEDYTNPTDFWARYDQGEFTK